jgi:hypothetical protein
MKSLNTKSPLRGFTKEKTSKDTRKHGGGTGLSFLGAPWCSWCLGGEFFAFCFTEHP